MVVNEKSTLYIESSVDDDDFCPEYVKIVTDESHVYTTDKLTLTNSDWYEKSRTNSKKHAIKKIPGM